VVAVAPAEIGVGDLASAVSIVLGVLALCGVVLQLGRRLERARTTDETTETNERYIASLLRSSAVLEADVRVLETKLDALSGRVSTLEYRADAETRPRERSREREAAD